MSVPLKPIAWALSFAPLVAALIAYAWLPAQVVMQWGAGGNPNWMAPKAAFVAITLIFPAIAWLLLDGPASGAMPVKGNNLYVCVGIFAVIAAAMIASTVANLVR